MKKALVIGAARSGISVAKLLNKFNYQVYLTDANVIGEKAQLEELGIKVYDDGHPELLKDIDYDIIVKNPGIPYRVAFVKHFVDKGYFLYNEIDIAYQYAKNYQYASITGTNGKTTTTSILEHILKSINPNNIACGNIGLPLSEVVLTHQDENLKVAVEIAGFQLLGIKNYHPFISTITNLAPDHLDYFKSVEDYYLSKTLVYQNQDENDYFIINLDDENIVKYCQNVKAKLIKFSMHHQYDLYFDDEAVYLHDSKLFERKNLHLLGQHNLSNAMIAACMAYKMGVDAQMINQAISEFKGVEHRIEYVDQINGVKFYNDSKATTVESTMVALDSFDRPVILLAGGYDKKTGFDSILAKKDKIKQIIVFGDTKMQLKALFNDAMVTENIEEALNQACLIASNDDIVLLSPMCASYDQFKSYEHRGKVFKELVNKKKGAI